MKDITRKSRNRRFRVPHKLFKSQGDKVKVTYAAPTNSNDLQRWGREMAITLDNVQVKLDGKAINSIKSVLRQAGEIA
jgi:hypothetical protein